MQMNKSTWSLSQRRVVVILLVTIRNIAVLAKDADSSGKGVARSIDPSKSFAFHETQATLRFDEDQQIVFDELKYYLNDFCLAMTLYLGTVCIF